MKRLITLGIERPDDVYTLRQGGRAAAEILGCDEADQVRFATALSEIGRESLLHKGRASAVFSLEPDGTLAVEIHDFPRAATGSASGYEAARKLVGEVSILNEKEHTVSVLLKRAPSAARGGPRIDARKILETLERAAPLHPLEELRLENRDLIATLNELRARQDELVQLNTELEETNRGVMAMYTQLAGELEETNRGVVALYAELDDKSARLNEANQSKSRFLANVSHELRSPVNSILGLLRLVLDPDGDALSKEQKKQLSLISKSAGELLQLVNALLDLAKAESGRLQPEITTFDLQDLFSELRGSLRPLARPDVTLAFDAPERMRIETDRLLLTQVLRNLVTNAMKFTPAGSVQITALLPAPYEVEIAVTDTGIGISAVNQPKIFEEFFQVQGPLQAEHKGSGLGLPYAKRVVQALGGEMTLMSTEGKGSTFTVRLPLRWQALLSAAESPVHIDLESVHMGTALIIDDDEGFRVALRGMLQGVARKVLEARGGFEGLSMMRKERPDIAFIDLRMPDIDGAQVLAEMNADPALREIPGIIITSTDLNAGNRATLGHASALMSKLELSKEKIASVISQALENRRAVH